MKKNRKYEVIVEKYEVSPDFDPRFSTDGGCYERPTIEGWVTWKGCRYPIYFVVDDTSCGDFGSRYEVQFVSGPAELRGRYTTNEVDFNGEIPDESTFKSCRSLLAIREEFRKATGFWFYMEDEVA